MARKKKSTNSQKIRQLITRLNPSAPATEQYRTIRTNLEYSSVDTALRSVLVTSPGPEAGKSATAANLAVVYAQQGKRVLLIDADLRKPSVHYMFQLDNLTGLSTILVEKASIQTASVQTDVDHLDVLPCGPIPPNPSELLGSAKMTDFLQTAEELYDMVLIDTPPVLAVADAQILANICSGSMLVVRSKQTEFEAAERASEILQTAQAKFLGILLNDVEKKGSHYYYYYYETE